MADYIELTPENIDDQHICCAIADKKYRTGVAAKKAWLNSQMAHGHRFVKLDARGKVFIEYVPLEWAWVPVIGDNYLYIHCLWVSGKFKKQGHASHLLDHCLTDARTRGKAGVCVIAGKKKTPFLSDGAFLTKKGFQVVDQVADYQLLAYRFDDQLPPPRFADTCRSQRIDSEQLTIYYSHQCPYILNCLEQTATYCEEHDIPLKTIHVDSLQMAKTLPAVFNNWAVFYRGECVTLHLLNANYLKKLLQRFH